MRVLVVLVLLVFLSSGCVQEPQKTSEDGPSISYFCFDGSRVSDRSLCPEKQTATPPTEVIHATFGTINYWISDENGFVYTPLAGGHVYENIVNVSKDGDTYELGMSSKIMIIKLYDSGKAESWNKYQHGIAGGTWKVATVEELEDEYNRVLEIGAVKPEDLFK